MLAETDAKRYVAAMFAQVQSENTHARAASHYHIFGLQVASSLAFPGIPRADAGPVTPDVVIRRGHVDSGPTKPPDAVSYFRTEASEFLLDIAGTARYVVRGGREIVVDPYPDALQEQVRLFLLGSALGALLYQRGLLLLHGSAVDTPWGAMIFIGAQGEGKSTLAAHLHRRGYPLISDDVCAVSRNATDEFLVHPALAQMRLCHDALARLDGFGAHAENTSFEVDKYVVALREPVPDRPIRIGAIYSLSSDEGAAPTIEALRGFDRLDHLVSNLYRSEFLPGMEAQPRVMALAGELSGAAAFMGLQRLRDASRMEESIECLETHWRTLPKIEKEDSLHAAG